MSPWTGPRLRAALAIGLLTATAIAILLLGLREVRGSDGSRLQIVLPTPSPTPSAMIVHVAGEVTSPGVYTFPVGTRLFEAIEAAGGALPEADTQRINLALTLVDGQRYLIPAMESGADAIEPTSNAGNDDAPIDINAATAEELQVLPGIGPVLANAIVSHRLEHGPYLRLEDLLGVSGIGSATLEKLRSQAIVR